MLRVDDPVRCPDGTWFILGASVPLFWGSSESAILSLVSERMGSVGAARELLNGGDARWAELAEREPALHRALTCKLKPVLSAPAPVAAPPRDRVREAAEAALERRRQAAEARRQEREAAALAYEAYKAEEEREERGRLEERRRQRAAQEEERKRAAQRKAQEAAERKRAKEAAVAERRERIRAEHEAAKRAYEARKAQEAAARELAQHDRPAWYEQARQMRADGASLADIAAHVGRAISSVSRVCTGVVVLGRIARIAAEAAEVVELRESGLTFREIGARCGKSTGWVKDRLRVGRLNVRERRGPKRKIADEQAHEIARRYDAGETLRALACAYGVSDYTIRGAIHRVGGKTGQRAPQRPKPTATTREELRADQHQIEQWGYV